MLAVRKKRQKADKEWEMQFLYGITAHETNYVHVIRTHRTVSFCCVCTKSSPASTRLRRGQRLMSCAIPVRVSSCFSHRLVIMFSFVLCLLKWGSQDMSEGSGPLQHQRWIVPLYPPHPPLKTIMCRRREGRAGAGRGQCSGMMLGFLIMWRFSSVIKTSWLLNKWPNLPVAASAALFSPGLLLYLYLTRVWYWKQSVSSN